MTKERGKWLLFRRTKQSWLSRLRGTNAAAAAETHAQPTFLGEERENGKEHSSRLLGQK